MKRIQPGKRFKIWVLILFTKLKRRILKSEFIKSVIILFSGNIISNLLSFISIPLLSRIYNDVAFGNYALLISTSAIIIAISSLGLSSAIMIPKDENKSKKVFSIAYFSQLSITTLVIFVLILISPWYKIYTVNFNYCFSLILIYIYVVIFGLFGLLSVYVNRAKKNRVLFWNSLIHSIVLLLVTVPLGYIGLGAKGFMIGSIVGYLAANVQMLYNVNPFIKITLRDYILILKEFRQFIFFQFPSNLIGIISQQIPNQFFSARFGNAKLGNYAMSERALGTPIGLVAAPINTIYFRHSAQIVNNNAFSNLGDFTYRLITKILIFSFLPIVILIQYSEQIFTFFLGHSWSAVGEIVVILTIPYILMFCTKCISYCLVVINRQKINLYLTLFHLLLIISSLYLGLYFYGDFTHTLMLFSIANSIYYLVNLFVIFFYLKYNLLKFGLFILIYSSLLYLVILMLNCFV